MTAAATPVLAVFLGAAFGLFALCWLMVPELKQALYRAERKPGSDRQSGFDAHDRGQYYRAWFRLVSVAVQRGWPASLRRKIWVFRLLNCASLLLFIAPWIMAGLEQ